MPRLAIHLDAPFVQVNDLFDDGQAQTLPGTSFLSTCCPR